MARMHYEGRIFYRRSSIVDTTGFRVMIMGKRVASDEIREDMKQLRSMMGWIGRKG